MGNYPTGTVTFLFTDIEGSTKLAQEYPDHWEAMRERHDAILKSAIETHRGHVFQVVGDAFCAAFHSATDALRSAVMSQLDLARENWSEASIKVRMGIHTGKAEIQAGGVYHGYLTLSRVQRLMSARRRHST
jgi:class 3 adenylate cyclase